MLSIRDLAVQFESEEGVVRALDGISLDLHAGRTLGIVGESGCGKSVTARSILRLIDRPGRITAGRILLDPGSEPDRPHRPGPGIAAHAGGPRRPVGLIFQEPMTALTPLHRRQPDHRGGAAARRHLAAEARDQAIGLLRDVGIPHPERRIDAYPFELSGGLRQRVGIAMALAGSPASSSPTSRPRRWT